MRAITTLLATLGIHGANDQLLHERSIVVIPEHILIDVALPDGVFVVGVEHNQQLYTARPLNGVR